MVDMPKRIRRTPIRRHRDQMRGDYASLKEEGPLIVTVHGEDAGVLLAPSDYDALVQELDDARLALEIRRAESGPGQPAADGFAEFEKRHGIKRA